MSDLSGYIQMRFFDGRQVDDEWKTQCPWCHNEKNRAFINTVTGSANCKHCDWKASGWVSLIAVTEGLKTRNEIAAWIKEHEDELRGIRTAVNDLGYTPARRYMNLYIPSACKPVENNDAYAAYIRSRGFTEVNDLIQEYNIHKCEEGKYINRIVFPLYEGPQLMYFFDRTIDPLNTRKTLGVGTHDAYWPVDKSEVIFNIDTARKQTGKKLAIAEGIFSALAVEEMTLTTCVALLGKACSEQQLQKIVEIKPCEVELCLDPDALKKTYELALRLQSFRVPVSVRYFSKGDPNDYLLNDWGCPRAERFDSFQFRLRHASVIATSRLSSGNKKVGSR